MAPTTKSAALFLRVDGTLLMSAADQALEIKLTPEQLLYLGTDALRLSLMLDPRLAARVADALENTTVLVPVDPPDFHRSHDSIQ